LFLAFINAAHYVKDRNYSLREGGREGGLDIPELPQVITHSECCVRDRTAEGGVAETGKLLACIFSVVIFILSGRSS